MTHTMFFDETGPADFQPDPRMTRTYLTFGCTLIACGYRDFVVADDYESAHKAAVEAFNAVDAH